MQIGISNPFVHSPWDTLDKLSLTHMTDYAKLAIAFAVELGEPMSTSVNFRSNNITPIYIKH